jgi:hypothetical protein
LSLGTGTWQHNSRQTQLTAKPVLALVSITIILFKPHRIHDYNVLSDDSVTDSTFWWYIPRFGLQREHYSTVSQLLCLSVTTETCLQHNCISVTATFVAQLWFYITQTFDKVTHPGLLFKIRKTFPHTYHKTFKYLMGKLFQTKFKDEAATSMKTEAGILQ